ncbi:Zwei Ig domain protein zig-8 [Nymphon striatum]|nr:Zwei Ig domain protein zig-8 [Nymphon striatum]
MKCGIGNAFDETEDHVSWIRTRDFHVLTVGLYRYTTDKRFSAIHSEDSNEWTLKISYTNLTDIGTYECQVNSDPKLSYFVSLNVVVPKTKITSAPDLYVRSGSSIRLECIISQSPDPPVFVFWYHDERMINYDVKRSRIKTAHKLNKNTARSVLTIDDAGPSDSGNYTCYPSNSKKAHITVHVLNGEKPAAMQDHENNKTSRSIRICPLSSFVFISSICNFILVLFPR